MTFTLIICTRNRAESLRRCLAALDVSEIRAEGGEVVVVDNGSIDRTQEVIRVFQRDTFGETLAGSLDTRPGKPYALNTGMRHASGEVFAFTDDDCYVQKGFFRELMREFRRGEIDYCAGRILLYDPTDARRAVNYDTERRDFPAGAFLNTGAVQGANMAFHRRVFDRIGPFDTAYCGASVLVCEDIDVAGRASQAGFRGAFLPQLVVYHHHGRKPGSAELAATIQAYDIGRGAYYASRLLAGDWQYLPGWIRTRVERKRSLRSFGYELLGVARYLRSRLSLDKPQQNF